MGHPLPKLLAENFVIVLALLQRDETTNGLASHFVRFADYCGFGDSGILLTGHSNIVAGNFIGTTADGLDARGNVLYGVYLANGASDNTIGGSNAGAGNVISASGSTGVYLEGATTTGNAVLGNLIGTDKNGTAKLPNFDGIAISNASGNRIGGPAAGERNVISGNTRFGVHLSSLSGNVVQGNYVGTDVTGAETHGVENGHGVFLNGDLDSLIGGTQPGEGNAIAGSGWGIWLGGVTSNRHTSGTRIHGNRIGTSADGSQARGNSWGIYVEGQDGHEVHDVLIGGSTPGAGNLISGNYLEGIIMRGGGAQRIHIQGNSIHANGGLGIDLNGDGVTQNDSGDGDSGPNNLRNFPVLTSAAAGGSTRVTGTLNSTPGSVSTLDFYASAAADPSGFGEGQRWLGSIIVSTDLTGNAAFDANLIAATAIGEFITATATDTNGNTSEFCGSKEISVLATGAARTTCLFSPHCVLVQVAGVARARPVDGRARMRRHRLRWLAAPGQSLDRRSRTVRVPRALGCHSRM
jgi:hypothetical protein